MILIFSVVSTWWKHQAENCSYV